MDESCKPLVGEVTTPIPLAPRHPVLRDDEYVRNGVAEIFLAVEPLAGKHHVKVTERRTRLDWPHFIRETPDERYPGAEKVLLVLDNLNTHAIGSLCAAFPPFEARRLAERLKLHHTPRHGNWLNTARMMRA